DPEGLRVVRKARGETTHYVFEGTEPIYEKNVTTGKARSYVFALGKHIARVDGVIGDSQARKYWYTTDHLGSVRAVTGQDGRVVYQADHTPFGRQYANKLDPGFEADDLGFTGKGFDADSGLWYFNARWYDADTGRFISEDPARDPNSGLYTYCANNPLSNVDPTGLILVSVNGGTIDTETGVFTPYTPDSGGGSVNIPPTSTQQGSSGISNTLTTMQNAGLNLDTIRTAYLQYWNNLSDDFYTDPYIVQQNLKVLWMGIDILGKEAMPAYGWGLKGDHIDTASMNMVRTVQAAAGVQPDGKFGDITLAKMQLLGFCKEIFKDGKGTGKYYPVGQAATNLLLKRMDQTINSRYIWPTTGRISSPYDPNRPGFTTKDGIKVPPGHRAIDIANQEGTPVVAIANGTVSKSYWSDTSGWILEIDYGYGVTSIFHHLNEQSSLPVGTQVSQGEVVALMGGTGTMSTGSHLHFALKINGVAVDPNNYLPPW
ncbi:MAG: peptidoglycan DD-metalloendopeptidase family protein, partial [Firmicutes bacterium]|nr:peptidoglycan DD-metalloendopeptidase family protein [Bacillota bacterium]